MSDIIKKFLPKEVAIMTAGRQSGKSRLAEVMLRAEERHYAGLELHNPFYVDTMTDSSELKGETLTIDKLMETKRRMDADMSATVTSATTAMIDNATAATAAMSATAAAAAAVTTELGGVSTWRDVKYVVPSKLTDFDVLWTDASASIKPFIDCAELMEPSEREKVEAEKAVEGRREFYETDKESGIF